LGRLVRRTFYGHFSTKNYRDLELEEVDRILQAHEKISRRPWKDLPPENLGELLHADFLLYGKVNDFRKYFLGIYSQIALEVELKMVKTKGGEEVWSKTLLRRSHDGGVPFSLFGIIPASLRSGLHMREERTVALVDRLTRELVKDIPDPSPCLVAPRGVDIQIASFLDGERALGALKSLEKKGYRPRIETVILGGRRWHRLYLGPYRDEEEAEGIKKAVERDFGFRPFLVRRYPLGASP